jgi:hypothetical protein
MLNESSSHLSTDRLCPSPHLTNNLLTVFSIPVLSSVTLSHLPLLCTHKRFSVTSVTLSLLSITPCHFVTFMHPSTILCHYVTLAFPYISSRISVTSVTLSLLQSHLLCSNINSRLQPLSQSVTFPCHKSSVTNCTLTTYTYRYCDTHLFHITITNICHFFQITYITTNTYQSPLSLSRLATKIPLHFRAPLTYIVGKTLVVFRSLVYNSFVVFYPSRPIPKV